MIELSHLNFTYSKNRSLFEDLSLHLEGGHIYGLLGKNGAGKTTLLKLIAGLRLPQSGVSMVLGNESKKHRAEMLQELFFLPEEIWLPDTTVKGYLNMFAGSYPKFDMDYFHYCIKEFEINTNDKLKSMSFGQRKKVSICFALATKCRILILDEPTNGLDIPSKTQFRKLVAEAITDDRCLILSTHQVRDLESLIDTIIILENRQVLMNETTEEIGRKLEFKTLFSIENQPNLLYSEFTPKGFVAIFPGKNDPDSRIDLEALFNLATQQPDTIRSVFNH
ncbi:MAG TPA: ABC transporter ATP-binding protein [Bacteroidales bacterium]|nr:ABC transporter ATP-binding protein [Bacteroidales bacterium]